MQQLEVGQYAIFAVNPGGLEANLGTFRIAFRKAVDVNLSAGYAPLIPIYGRINELLEAKAFPMGAYAKLNVMPFKRNWGYLGVELEPYWNYMMVKQDYFGDYFEVSAQIMGAQVYGIYQHWFPNRIMSINVRAGAGLYSVMDYHFKFSNGKSEPMQVLIPTLAAGASFQWLVWRRLFVEAGVEYSHFLTVDNPQPGYIKPFLGAGWQF
jgi:hypothetical protein